MEEMAALRKRLHGTSQSLGKMEILEGHHIPAGLRPLPKCHSPHALLTILWEFPNPQLVTLDKVNVQQLRDDLQKCASHALFFTPKLGSMVRKV